MKQIDKKLWPYILEGVNLFGTGGGGTIQEADEIFSQTGNSFFLSTLNELKPSDTICTVFGVGGKKSCDAVKAASLALNIFQSSCKRNITALIPVEAGCVAVSTVICIASKLKIPVVDSDIVGQRSSPEVYLETISLKSLDRTPCVVADDKGNFQLIEQKQSFIDLENKLRRFAVQSGGDAYVAGYPLRVSQIKQIVPEGTISLSLKQGRDLLSLRNQGIELEQFCRRNGWIRVTEGIITKNEIKSVNGFEVGSFEIDTGTDTYKVIFKNENLVLIKGKKTIATCPDLISLLFLDSFQAVNNFEDKVFNRRVAILLKKAIPLWRSIAGRRLFDPKKLGLNYSQVLIPD